MLHGVRIVGFRAPPNDLKLLAWGLDITETNKLIRNAIACNHWMNEYDNVAWKKSKNLTLETAISIGWMFEATRDGLQVTSSEDPRIEVSKVTWKKDSSRQHKKARNFKKPKSNNEQAQKCDRCGYSAHKPQEKCPAKNELCNKCRKIGHFAQAWGSRKSIVNVLNETDYSGDEYSSDEEGADRDLQPLDVASL